MKVVNDNQPNLNILEVYSSRIDTIFGMTYVVLSSNYKDIEKFITPEQKEVCEKYIEGSIKKLNKEVTTEEKEKN